MSVSLYYLHIQDNLWKHFNLQKTVRSTSFVHNHESERYDSEIQNICVDIIVDPIWNSDKPYINIRVHDGLLLSYVARLCKKVHLDSDLLLSITPLLLSRNVDSQSSCGWINIILFVHTAHECAQRNEPYKMRIDTLLLKPLRNVQHLRQSFHCCDGGGFILARILHLSSGR